MIQTVDLKKCHDEHNYYLVQFLARLSEEEWRDKAAFSRRLNLREQELSHQLKVSSRAALEAMKGKMETLEKSKLELSHRFAELQVSCRDFTAEKSKLKVTIDSLGTKVKDLESQIQRERNAVEERVFAAERRSYAAGVSDCCQRLFLTSKGQDLLLKLRDGILTGYKSSAQFCIDIYPDVKHFFLADFRQGF